MNAGRRLVGGWSEVGRRLVGGRSEVGRRSVGGRPVGGWSEVGRRSIGRRSEVGRRLVGGWSEVGRRSVRGPPTTETPKNCIESSRFRARVAKGRPAFRDHITRGSLESIIVS